MQKVHISRHLEVQKQALTSSSALQILITTYNYNTEIAAQWRKDCFFRTIFHNQGFCLIVGLKLSKNLWKEIFLFENESWGCNEESCSFSCEVPWTGRLCYYFFFRRFKSQVRYFDFPAGKKCLTLFTFWFF